MSWPRTKAKVPVVLSGTGIEKLLAAMSNPMFRAVAMVMYGAGLRISEACALRHGHRRRAWRPPRSPRQGQSRALRHAS